MLSSRYPAALALLSLGSQAPAPIGAGSWAGDFRHPGMTLPIEIAIDSTGRSAVVSLRPWRLREALATVSVRGDTVEVTVPAAGDTARFRGTVRGWSWIGEARRGRDVVPIELRRVFPMTAAEWQRILGTYRSADGRLVAVSHFEEFGDRPMLVDFGSGRIGPLLPIQRDHLLVGRSLIAPTFPADTVELAVGPGGEVQTLRFSEAGYSPVAARRIATRDEEIQFSNGSIALAGTLTLPADAGPHPAIVLVHGSNAQTRQAVELWARYFAGLGFAVLGFDKRGTGRSTGDWKAADFNALAGDVLSGVRALARRPDIRADRIGLWGISQAGWIMPLVAAQAPTEIAFMVVHAGTGTTVQEQGILNYRNELRFAGVSDSAVAIGVRYRMLDDSVTRAGSGLEVLQQYYEAHRAEAPWLDEPAPLDAWFRLYYRMLMDYDTRETWERVTCPVLLFFGELDANVPPAESWPPIERALRRAGNSHVTQYVLPAANHVFLEAKTGARDEYPALRRFVPGYFDRMAQWLAGIAR